MSHALIAAEGLLHHAAEHLVCGTSGCMSSHDACCTKLKSKGIPITREPVFFNELTERLEEDSHVF